MNKTREIIVTGMHRSGTSAIADLIHNLGINIGSEEQLVAGAKDNEKGFFEDKEVLAVNNDILQLFHSDWHNIDIAALSTIEKQWCSEEIVLAMAAALQRYRDEQKSFLLKDPRFCLTLKAWAPLLHKPLIVICLRSPLEIAKSLQKRNGFSLFKGLGLWELYLKNLARIIEEMECIFVDFNTLLTDPKKECNKLVNSLRQHGVTVDYTTAATAVLDKKLHHENETASLEALLSVEQLKLWHNLQKGELPVTAISKEIQEKLAQQNTGVGYGDLLREMQLFYSDSEAFNEEDSIKIIRNGRHHSHTFILPKTVRDIHHLRFDPAAGPCIIGNFTIELYAGEQWVPCIKFKHNAIVNRDNNVLYFSNNDPCCFFSCTEEEITKVKIDVEFLHDTPAEADHLFTEFFTAEHIKNLAALHTLQREKDTLRVENKKNLQRLEKNLNQANEEKKQMADLIANAHQERLHSRQLLNLCLEMANRRNSLQQGAALFARLTLLCRQPQTISDYRLFLRYAKLCANKGLFFSEEYYISVYPDIRFSSLSPADHFFFIGWKERRNPGPMFYTNFYLDNHPEIITQGKNPLCHYLKEGWRQGDDPCPDFSTAACLAANMELFGKKCAPAYFTRHDAATEEKREEKREEIIFAERKYSCSRPVDVIIPTYLPDESAAAIFRRLLASLAASYPQESSLLHFIFIDDHSPHAVVEQLLAELGFLGRSDIIFSRNDKNLGFVDTVNLGLDKGRRQADVVLLNCDTEVHGDIFARLQNLCYRFPAVASVTPLSNRATIASLTNWPLGADSIFGFTPEEVAQTVHNSGLQSPLSPVPTGHGFCMYLCRAAIDAVGILDSKQFGQGYGEENDWSVRAIQHGFQHLISVECYVHHHETRSFTTEQKKELSRKNFSLLVDKHPWYPHMVTSYIEDDPLAHHRFLLKLLLLGKAAKRDNITTICFFLHDSFRFPFGGVQRHIGDLCQGLQQGDTAVMVISPMNYGEKHYEFTLFQGKETLFIDKIEVAELMSILSLVESRIDLLHLHHLLAMEKDIRCWLAGSSIARKYFTVHDLSLFGKNPFLLNDNGEYALAAGKKREEAFLPDREIAENLELLSGFSGIFTPSANTREALLSLWPQEITCPQIEVVPHFLPFIDELEEQLPEEGDAGRNIAFIGALSQHKGGDIFYSAVPELRQQGLAPMIFGITDPVTLKRFANEYIPVLPYRNWLELAELHNRFGLCCAVLPAICAETFSYTLYEALFILRVPVVVGPYGHPADLVHTYGMGEVMEDATPGAITAAVEKITANRPQYIAALNNFIRSHRKDFSARSYLTNYRHKLSLPSAHLAKETRKTAGDTISLSSLFTPDREERNRNSNIWLQSTLSPFTMLLVRPERLSLTEEARCTTIASLLQTAGCNVEEATPPAIYNGLHQIDIIYLHGELPTTQLAPFTTLAKKSGIPIIWDYTSSLPPFTVDTLLGETRVLQKEKNRAEQSNTPMTITLPIVADEQNLTLFKHLYKGRQRQKDTILGLFLPKKREESEAIFSFILPLLQQKRNLHPALQLTLFSDSPDQLHDMATEPWISIQADCRAEEFYPAISRCAALLLPAASESSHRQQHHLVLAASLMGTPVITNCRRAPYLPAENGISGWFLPAGFTKEHTDNWLRAICEVLADSRGEMVGSSAHTAVLTHGRGKAEDIFRIFAGIIQGINPSS